MIAWIESLIPYLPGCTLYNMTGFYCPGCGGTRATLAFLKGHFVESFFYHPVVDYTAALILLYAGWYLVWALSGKRIKPLGFHPGFFYVMIGLVVIQWFIKNYMLIRHGIRLI